MHFDSERKKEKSSVNVLNWERIQIKKKIFLKVREYGLFDKIFITKGMFCIFK